MKYRPFGTTGLEVSEIVFGGGAVGGLLINSDDDSRLKAFRLAMEAGINWIDTAPAYGSGISEQVIGTLLKETGATPHVSTKVTIDTRNPDILGQIEASLTASLERLGCEQLTLLQLHNPIASQTDKRVIGIGEVLKPHGILDCMAQLQHQGLIQHFGITALGENTALTKVIKSNRLASAQVYFNLLNPSAALTPPPSWPCYNFTGIVDTCFEHGVAPMNIRVLSAGVIATHERHGRERPLTAGDTVESETQKATHLFSIIGNEEPRAQTAIRFALAQPRIACVVVGLAEIEHLELAIAAADKGPLSPEELATIQEAWSRY